MPKKPRMYQPDVPCHVIQRGNNREACFYSDRDYQFYLDCLEDASHRHGVRVHAYVLMTNHVHILMAPGRKNSIGLTMQSIGRRYVQFINKAYQRTGTLWESRYKASLVDKDRYLLTCMRYIELNPVRANMIAHPGEYKWSSYRSNGTWNHGVRLFDIQGTKFSPLRSTKLQQTTTPPLIPVARKSLIFNYFGVVSC